MERKRSCWLNQEKTGPISFDSRVPIWFEENFVSLIFTRCVVNRDKYSNWKR